MTQKRNRLQLSPRLRLGIGRNNSKNSILRYSSHLFILIAIALSINTFRLLLKNTDPNLSNHPQVLGISDTKSSKENTNEAEFDTYKVKKGDTLFNIAQNFQISWTTLATLNNIQSPFSVTPGQELKVPTLNTNK